MPLQLVSGAERLQRQLLVFLCLFVVANLVFYPNGSNTLLIVNTKIKQLVVLNKNYFYVRVKP